MKRSEIRKVVAENCNTFTFHKDGTITAKWSYFYRMGHTPEKYAEKIKAIFPTATIVETGDHFHAFVGGAKTGSACDSYMWVHFQVV